MDVVIARLFFWLVRHSSLEFEDRTSNWAALLAAAKSWRPTFEDIQITKAQSQYAARPK